MSVTTLVFAATVAATATCCRANEYAVQTEKAGKACDLSGALKTAAKEAVEHASRSHALALAAEARVSALMRWNFAQRGMHGNGATGEVAKAKAHIEATLKQAKSKATEAGSRAEKALNAAVTLARKAQVQAGKIDGMVDMLATWNSGRQTSASGGSDVPRRYGRQRAKMDWQEQRRRQTRHSGKATESMRLRLGTGQGTAAREQGPRGDSRHRRGRPRRNGHQWKNSGAKHRAKHSRRHMPLVLRTHNGLRHLAGRSQHAVRSPGRTVGTQRNRIRAQDIARGKSGQRHHDGAGQRRGNQQQRRSTPSHREAHRGTKGREGSTSRRTGCGR
ncbi:hypothetical protein, conserved in T. vivax [Trypanosoma vivax Y486]|uniref:Trypanosoma vivax n=1 Tax=Trypanosoma vivax (strain Y486) TaxID=1055687 RepID=F9WQF6_TRYVY|nr:hypothetical protein, conserved in T. vivax [Trypanosoma vivax Y486]|eukprot:CCD19784.1 hypothetical protein, conserved in T. vivax [Trypanosoma vivax Y486]